MSASRSVWPVVLALSNLYALSKASARTSSALIRAFLANLYKVNNTQLQREGRCYPFIILSIVEKSELPGGRMVESRFFEV